MFNTNTRYDSGDKDAGLTIRPASFIKQHLTQVFLIPIICLASIFLLSGCDNVYSTSFAAASTHTTSLANNHILPMVTQPIASSGCGKPAPITPGTSVMGHLAVSGLTRYYLLHLPPGYQNKVPYPLVLNFHGHGSNALQQQYRTGFSTLANRYHFVVAYPQGVVGPDHHTGWNIGPRWDPHVNDVLFTASLLTRLQATVCVNPQRIYVTGFSNGGGMTNLLACKLAGRVAAFASVSGSYPSVPGGCHPKRPVPLLEIHGTGDHIVPYGGSLLKGYPPIALWLQGWVLRNGCSPTPTIFLNQDGLLGEQWTCHANTVLVHYRVKGMPHMWPLHYVLRSKGSSTTFDASTTIWNFFTHYTLA